MKRNSGSDSVNISEKWFTLVPKRDKFHLLNSLRNLRRLQPPTPSFKLYGRDDWSVVTDFLSSPEVKRTLPPKWLIEYELSRESKFGDQGGHAPWSELRDNAELYFSRPKDVRYEVDPDCIRKYGKFRLLMSSVDETIDQMKHDGKIMERANGWRLFSLKKTDPAAQRDAKYLIRTGLWKKGWAYFFSRFNKQKKRLFMPMPFCANVRQGQWANKFLKAIQEDLRQNLDKSEFIFWGDKIGFVPLFLQIMTPKLQGLDVTHLVYCCRDFEKMDTSVGVAQKSQSFVPKVAVAYGYTKGTKPYEEMEEAMLFSNRCPIATPDGMWTGDHGEASGATVTNMGEGCCNEDYDNLFQKILREKAAAVGITYRVIITVGNGDDGLTIYYLDDISRFAEFKDLIAESANEAAELCGYVVQGDKWDVNLATYGKYCQFLPSFDEKLNRVRMRYPAALILNAIMHPEKQYHPVDWDKDYRDHEVIDRLNNGWDLEYFHELVDYVDNGMKFRLLGKTEREFHRILSKWDKYLSLQPGSREFNALQEQWNTDPYSSPVVQYLMQKRGYTKPVTR